MPKKKATVKAPVAKVEKKTQLVRVVKPVEGRQIGEEFECGLKEYKLQIKHGSIEVIG